MARRDFARDYSIALSSHPVLPSHVLVLRLQYLGREAGRFIETSVAALRHEVEQVTRLIPRRQRVQHVHFGGGTPTILQPNTLVELVRLLQQSFDLAADAEVAIEIDPRTLDKDTASALAGCGVNRASLGIQSFDPLVQQSINRTQTVAQTASVVAALRRRGVNGIISI
jgi:oxygen-independent coproporphyrinogen III oxidase